MRAGTIGEVIESKNPNFNKGDILSGWGGVQQYSITNGKGYFKVPSSKIPLPTFDWNPRYARNDSIFWYS